MLSSIMLMEVAGALISTLLSRAAKLLLVERDRRTMLTSHPRHCSEERIGGAAPASWRAGELASSRNASRSVSGNSQTRFQVFQSATDHSRDVFVEL